MKRFPKTNQTEIDRCQREQHKQLVAHATKQYPKLCGGRWDSIGCPTAWTNRDSGYEAFIEAAGKLRRLQGVFNKWERVNASESYSAANLKVVLKPEWKAQVIAAIKEQLSQSKDLKVVLDNLNKIGCPSENGKSFTELGLKEFIRLNKL